MRRKLLVILITFNNENYIEDCLNSIIKQTFGDFRLLIIDNHSNDKTIKVIKNYLSNNQKLKDKTDILKNSQNIGFARAVNIGLKKALREKNLYKTVLLINPDTYFDKYLFKNGIDALFLEKDIGACCPKILYPDGRIWWIGTRLLTPKEIVSGPYYGISKHIDQGKKKLVKKGFLESNLLTGCAMFIKIEAIKKVGLFNEHYFMYVEDIDYSLRLLKAGYKLFLISREKVYHAQKRKKESVLLELRHYIIGLNSIGKYILKNYSLYIFIAWLIKLPHSLGFRYIKKIKKINI